MRFNVETDIINVFKKFN